MNEPRYPWYAAVHGDEIQQGDIIEACPVFQLPTDLPEDDLDSAGIDLPFTERDVIVMSQSCDMVKGREKIDFILLCTVWRCSEQTDPPFDGPGGFENARKGNMPAFHMIAACDIPGHECEARIVDFHRVYTLPLGFARERALGSEGRLRLLPPYREHLSQAFARFFMRVGLPVDIPPFR